MLSKDEFQAYLDVRTTKMLMITLYRLGAIDEKIIKAAWSTLSSHSFKYSGVQHTRYTKEEWSRKTARTTAEKNGC